MALETVTPAPVPLPVVDNPNSTAPTTAGAAVDTVVSLRDYLAAHPPPAAPGPSPAPLPRAISARSSKHIILLHEKCQALGISRPIFTSTGSSEQGWGSKVIFAGLLGNGKDVSLDEAGAFASKQEAKEKLSEQALVVLEELEREGHVQKKGKGKKRTEEKRVDSVVVVAEEEPVVNYIGQLIEFQRSINAPEPLYTDYVLNSTFSCEATIEGHASPFGSKSTFYPSKKAARRAAARAAVEHFRAEGLWPDDAATSPSGGIRKKKKAPPSPQPPALADATAGAPSAAGASGGAASYAQQVAQLAVELALGTPTWNFTSDPAAPNVHSVSCSFDSPHARHGPIGEVHHVIGRKKAKEACARLTLEYLITVREERLSYGRKAMEGAVGGGAVAGVAVKEAAEGTVEESEDEFVDAVEGVDSMEV